MTILRALLHKISSYSIFGSVYTTVNFFISGRQIKDVVNNQSSEAYAINESMTQSYLPNPTPSLHVSNDLSTNILRSLVLNIDEDDITIYERTS